MEAQEDRPPTPSVGGRTMENVLRAHAPYRILAAGLSDARYN